jgi:hypothetical protein
MTGSATRWWVLGVVLVMTTPAFAQSSSGFRMQPVAAKYVASQGELHGVIHDERGQPLPNAIISASGLGSSSMFVLSDRDGRFAFRSLRPGAYLLRAYLAGYASPSDSYVQVAAGARQISDIALNKKAVHEPTQVLQAGVGPAPAASEAGTPTDNHDGGEVPYRMRRLPRGVLKDAYTAAIDREDHPLEGLVPPASSASKGPRLLTIFDTVNGQVNLLTTTSFSRPQDLFDASAGTPRPIAYVSLVAPLSTGDWAIRGSMTEGDIPSWILAGSFTRHSVSSHTYQVGLSYATQRYQGANAEAITSMRDGSRNVGEISIDDSWAILPRLVLATGGRYANYDYLSDRVLLGGRFSIGYQVVPTDPLKVRLTASHRELAPGAEEFVAPTVGLWLPPERTFSPLSRNGELRPEKVDTVELSSERPVGRGVVVGVRAFRQQVDNQLVTLFGSMRQGPSLGHYRVSSAGDFENYGWGTTVSRQIGIVQASLDYTMTDTQRRGFSADGRLLRLIAPATLRRDENVHDLTASVNSRLDATGTRFLVVYKLNNAYADVGTRTPETGVRFDIQINQEMPFLNFTGARWEMLVGVRNLFRSELFEGSVYDELLVVRPPTRITGGVTVRF